ncbi:MAG TPA: dihydrolipoamide acetyltransferase, partial [Candidatus Eisenbacteria bacterium]|nr:dihydrolipoamide acetyltransferase [Candidatus Eisenbacteria bacterium]
MRVPLRAAATALVAALAAAAPLPHAHAQAPRAAPPPPSPSQTDTVAVPLRVVLGQGPAFAAAAFDSATGSWGAACAASEIAVGARAL